MHITIDLLVSRQAGFGVCLFACLLLPVAPTLVQAQQNAANTVAGRDTASEKVKPAAVNDPRSETVPVTVVDEENTPVAGVVVRVLDNQLNGSSKVTLFKTGTAGECRIPRPLQFEFPVVSLTAADETGARQGYLQVSFLDLEWDGKSLRMILKPSRKMIVRVTDKTENPVRDAQVGILHQLGDLLGQGRTDDDGIVRLRIPLDAQISSIFALKSGLGFSTWLNDFADQTWQRRDPPSEVKLALGGAQSVRIRAVDSANRPVAGIAIFPQLIGRPGRPRSFFNYSRAADTLTDDQGVATIDWFPVDSGESVSFSVHSPDYFLPESALVVDQNSNPSRPREFTAVLRRRTKISGRVTGPDGKPAAGIRVKTSARPNFSGTGVMAARTAADGTYALHVDSQHAYMVSVVDDDWTANSHVGVVVLEDKPVDRLDFELIKGTVIRGTITSGTNPRPAAKEVVSLSEIGGPVPPELVGPGARLGGQMYLGRRTLTDAEGRYQFRVGPGQYQLQPPADPSRPLVNRLTVSDEAEIKHDFHLEALETDTLTGTVVRNDGGPVRDIVIRGTYSDRQVERMRRRELKAISDADGKFSMERRVSPLGLFARSPDGALAGWVQVVGEPDSVELKISPTSTHVGRLIDDDGPIAGAELAFGPKLTPAPGGNRFAQVNFCEIGNVETDQEGRFALSGLVVGEEYVVQMHRPGETAFWILPFATPATPGNPTWEMFWFPIWCVECSWKGWRSSPARPQRPSRKRGRFPD